MHQWFCDGVSFSQKINKKPNTIMVCLLVDEDIKNLFRERQICQINLHAIFTCGIGGSSLSSSSCISSSKVAIVLSNTWRMQKDKNAMLEHGMGSINLISKELIANQPWIE